MVNPFRNALITVYKPVGPSSFKLVSKIKRVLKGNFRKIGHFGTLDPFAEGLLLIGTDSTLRFTNLVHEHCPKKYIAKGVFGELKDTGDVEGKTIEQASLPELEICAVEDIVASFLGNYSQKPPAFSATKHKGKALYEYARKGEFIDKPPVEREIFDIKVLSYNSKELVFEATVSTGTYIRVLFEDIARAMGSVGHLTELGRVGIGNLTIGRDESSIESIEDIENKLTRIDEILSFPRIDLVDEKLAMNYRNGLLVELNDVKDGEHWIYGLEGNLLGLGNCTMGLLKPTITLSDH